jgi:hypothetical protein
MKRSFLLMLALATVITFAQAQTPKAQTTRTLKKVTELKMPKTTSDDMPGTRGASVVWHPVQRKYYAVFAGNMGYPLAVFDERSKRISEDDLTAMIDTRGLWYDPVTKLITGNGYDVNGWFTYKLSPKGIPTDFVSTKEGMNQPNEQCVGAYNSLAKQVFFLKGGQVYKYSKDAELLDSIAIHWSRKKADGPADDEDRYSSPEDHNYTSLIFTNIKMQELGFLNITNKEIEFYDLKTGYLTNKLALPETAVVESSFNFAYANGIYWLFNIEDRNRVGYK